jgi:hypothetical protein
MAVATSSSSLTSPPTATVWVTDLHRECARSVGVPVEDRDLQAESHEVADSGGAKAAGAAGDNRCASREFRVHQ